MQTCSKNNEVQLITNVLPQVASASDQDALKTMVDLSVASDTKPNTLLTDAGYGSDAFFPSASELLTSICRFHHPRNETGVDLVRDPA